MTDTDAPHRPPDRCDPWYLARTATTLEGTCAVAQLERLADALADTRDSIPWSAAFFCTESPGEQPASWVDISGGGELALSCSRCGEPVRCSVQADRRLRLIADEALAARLDEAAADHDVIAVPASLDLLTLLEDELIMALPTWPEHRTCPVATGASAGQAIGPDADDRQYPFADLPSRWRKQ